MNTFKETNWGGKLNHVCLIRGGKIKFVAKKIHGRRSGLQSGLLFRSSYNQKALALVKLIMATVTVNS